MQGDFTRDSFDPTRRFSRVLIEQGRPLLDAELNEQTSILLHYLQTLSRDVIGPFAGPSTLFELDNILNRGFDITAIENTSLIDDFNIGPGRYYVDGLLCENPSLTDISYFSQADFPLNPDTDKLPDPPFLIYLDVWEKYVTSLEQPTILDAGVGVPTASRARLLTQVKASPKIIDQDIITSLLHLLTTDQDKFNAAWTTWAVVVHSIWSRHERGKLQAWANPPTITATNDPCIIPSGAGYRGTENQLYRVEIHQGTDAQASLSFKWSRNNASLVAQWVSTDGINLIVEGGRYGGGGFVSGQWVELLGDEYELRSRPGTLVQLSKVEGNILTIDSTTIPTGGIPVPGTLTHPKIRGWDQKETADIKLSAGAIPLKQNTVFDLEDGIQISFPSVNDAAAPEFYYTGDYWLIPARAVIGDVGTLEWPMETLQGATNPTPVSLPPHGVEHHYAPLAIVMDGTHMTSLRRTWRPPMLTKTVG